MQKADKLYFDELVKKYMADEFTEAQAQYLAYKDMGLDIPVEVKKKVRDEELTLDIIGSKYLPLKVKKRVNPSPAILYHFTSIGSAIDMLHQNTINARVGTSGRAVSFTRDKMFQERYKGGNKNEVAFILDREKIKKYFPGLSPVAEKAFSRANIRQETDELGSTGLSEAEERITNNLQPLKKFLLAVVINSDNVNDYNGYRYIDKSKYDEGMLRALRKEQLFLKNKYLEQIKNTIQKENPDIPVIIRNRKDWLLARDINFLIKPNPIKNQITSDKVKKKVNPRKNNPDSKSPAKEFSHFDVLIDNLYDFNIPDVASFNSIRHKNNKKYFQVHDLHQIIGKPVITREKILSDCKLILNIREDVAMKLDDEITRMAEAGMTLENIKLFHPDYDYHLPLASSSFFISLPEKKITTFKTESTSGIMDIYLQGIYVKSLMVEGRISYKFYMMIEMYKPETPTSPTVLVGKFLNFTPISEKEFIELPSHNTGNAAHFICYILLKGITDCYLAGIREKRNFSLTDNKGKFVKLKYPSSVIVYQHKQYEPSDEAGVKYDFYKGRNVIGHYRHFYIKDHHGKRVIDNTGHWVLDTTKPVGGGKDEFENRPGSDFFKGRTYVKPHYNDLEHNDFVRKYIKMDSKRKNNPLLSYKKSAELNSYVESLNDTEREIIELHLNGYDAYDISKELDVATDKVYSVLEKIKQMGSFEVYADDKKFKNSNIDISENILIKDFDSVLKLVVFNKPISNYSDLFLNLIYSRVNRISFQEYFKDPDFSKNVVAVITYKLGTEPRLEKFKKREQIFINTMIINKRYSRNGIIIYLLNYISDKYSISLFDFGATSSDAKMTKKYLSREGKIEVYDDSDVYSLKTKPNPKRKSNPIIIDALSKTDFIVRRTEDGKFFVIRKVPGGYTLAGSKRDEDGEYVINSYSVSKFKNKKAAIEKATEALGRKNNPGKICEQCEKRQATTKFRSIMVCSKCEDILSGEEKEYRGSDIEEYEEYDDEGSIVPRKENPTQYHGTIKEIDDDIKKQIIEMYKSGDTIIRIAKVVHLNVPLVKEVLAEANVPVRKGGHKERVKPNPRRSSSNFSSLVKSGVLLGEKIKRKSNPTEEATIQFINEAMKGIPQKWVELRGHKFGSKKYNNLIKIIMWRQGAVLGRVANSCVTTIMVSSLYDSFGVVEKDPEYYYRLCIYVALFDRSKADSIIQKLSKDSFGYKTTSYFDNTKGKGQKLYYDFMNSRMNNFVNSFLSISQPTRILDFTNFLRDFSKRRYSEKHDVLIEELTMKILTRPPGEELHQQEIDHAKEIIKNIHLEAMAVIARSKLYLTDYVKDIEKEKGKGNGKA